MQSAGSLSIEAGAACAWAFWFEWTGPLELVVRIARAAREAARQPGIEPPCRITLHVASDVEVFRSPEEFEAHATRSGLRAFDELAIAVGEVEQRITVRFAKRDVHFWGLWAGHWLPRGVLVQVLGPSEDTQGDACAKRDAVASAIARGAEGSDPALRGETWQGLVPQEMIEEALHRRGRTSRRERLVWAVLTPVFAILLLILITETGHEFIVRKVPSDTSGYDYGIGLVSGVVLLISCVLVGLLLAPAAKVVTTAVLPAVVIREHGSAAARVFRHVVNIALPLVTGAAVLSVWGVVKRFLD